MGSTELFFSRMTLSQSGFTSPARPRGAGGPTRENDSILSLLRARRAGRGARARARLATGGFPVDSPSTEPSGAEICLARPSRNDPPVEKNTILLCYTRFPSGTCLGEWRKNELKSIRFVSYAYYIILRRYEIFAL